MTDDPKRRERPDMIQALSDLSQDAVVMQLKALQSLRGGLAKAVAGDSFLVELAQVQLAYYGQLLQLVTGHFDRVTERLHELIPSKPAAKPTPLETLNMKGTTGVEATGELRLVNPYSTTGRVQFQWWHWCADGARYPMRGIAVQPGDVDLAGKKERAFTITASSVDLQPGTIHG